MMAQGSIKHYVIGELLFVTSKQSGLINSCESPSAPMSKWMRF
jgi:hypothetical protein